MKVTFLGTGAGEGYPSPWCSCPNCSYARQHGGKNLRNNSSALIDDDLLIDLTPQAYSLAAGLGLSLEKLQTLLVTHNHTDHYTPSILWTRHMAPQFRGLGLEGMTNRHSAPRMTPLPQLTVYGCGHIGRALEKADGITNPMEEYDLGFQELSAGQAVEIPGAVVIPVESNHVEPGFTFNYIIQRQGKTLLYASDTGGYSEPMLKVLLSHRYDGVIIEGTTGLMPTDGGHMSLERATAFLDKLREQGCIHGGTRCILTHMSPHWMPPHDQLEELLRDKGLEAAYDGQSICI